MSIVGDTYGGITREAVVLGLNSPNEGEKISMIRQIAGLGESAAAYLTIGEEMERQLSSPSVLVQKEALLALGKMGSEGLKSATAVVSKLKANTTSVVLAAITFLGMMGKNAAEFAVEVLPFVASTEEHLAIAAVTALGQMRATSFEKELVACLNSEVVNLSRAACAALAILGEETGKLRKDIVSLLESQDSSKRCIALGAMATFQNADTQHASAICRCLGDKDPLVRRAAIDYFGALQEKARPFAKVLLQGLASQDGSHRCAAALALAHVGDEAAAPEIAKLLDDSFVDQDSARLYIACIIEKPPASMRLSKCASCMALSMLGEAGESFATSVAALLNNADEPGEVREAALRALGNMGAEGARHHEKVFEFIDNKESPVACAAMIALGQMCKSIRPYAVAEAVAKKLKSSKPVIRATAARALSHMGAAAVPYTDNLAKCFEDRCPAVKIAAMCALTKLGKPAQVYAPAIAAMFPDESPKVRIAAIECMPLMGDRGAALINEMAECLEDPDGDVRVAAIAALGAFGDKASHLRHFLAIMGTDGLHHVRSAALQAIELVPE